MPALACGAGEVGGAGVVDAADQEAALVGRVDPVQELHERRAVGLLGAPVVEVVGLDVGDHRGVRAVDEERAVALVGLGDEEVAGPLLGVATGRGEVAADGVRRVRAGGLQGHREQRGGRGLAVRAGDGEHAASGHHRRRGAAERGSTRSPWRTASTYSGLSSRTAVETTSVSAPATWAASWPRWTRAPSARSASRVGESCGVAAADRDAAAEHDPGDAGQPGAADADEVHPAEPVGRAGSRRGPGPSSRRSRRLDDDPGELVVGVARDQRGRGRAHRARAGRRRWPGRGRWRATHSGGHRGVAPPGGRRRRPRPDARCASCSPLPIGSGTKIAGQAGRGGLGDAVGAGPADHQVGGGVGEVHPVDEVEHDVRAPRSARASASPFGPMTCSTCTPASARARAAAETDWLSRRAPCEPPVTSSVGRSGSRPKNARASARIAARSSREIIRPDRQPDVLGVRQRRVGEGHRDRGSRPGRRPCWPGRAGRSARGPPAAACGGGRRGTPAPRRSRRSRPRRRGGPGRGSPGSSFTAPRSRAGTLTRSASGRRGSGTGGISSSG